MRSLDEEVDGDLVRSDLVASEAEIDEGITRGTFKHTIEWREGPGFARNLVLNGGHTVRIHEECGRRAGFGTTK